MSTPMTGQSSKLSFVTTVLLVLALSYSSNAFTSTIRHSHLILPHSRHYIISPPPTTTTTVLHATQNDSSSHSHAPSYEKIDATLTQAERLAAGSTMLHIRASRSVDYYQPGHVLALEIEDNSPRVDDDDTVANDGWMRGPYTVSRCRGCDIDVLIKTVGKKSNVMAAAAPGTAFRIGGRFKVPILEGIARREGLKRVVMIATGVGVGPCVGAIEKALREDDDVDYPLIELIASFRHDDEVIYRDYLQTLVEKYGENRFRFQYVVTSQDGRLSCSDDMLESRLFSDETTNNSKEWTVDDTHYHLIGNGQMVNEFKAGLLKALVPEDRVTIEQYFNHKADVSDDVIDRIAAVVSKKTSVVSALR